MRDRVWGAERQTRKPKQAKFRAAGCVRGGGRAATVTALREGQIPHTARRLMRYVLVLPPQKPNVIDGGLRMRGKKVTVMWPGSVNGHVSPEACEFQAAAVPSVTLLRVCCLRGLTSPWCAGQDSDGRFCNGTRSVCCARHGVCSRLQARGAAGAIERTMRDCTRAMEGALSSMAGLLQPHNDALGKETRALHVPQSEVFGTLCPISGVWTINSLPVPAALQFDSKLTRPSAFRSPQMSLNRAHTSQCRVMSLLGVVLRCRTKSSARTGQQATRYRQGASF
ncbi:hypothetical protein EXIGLDRAFT_447770 [Exidia glandulosa HHB12029]|uniref:Uncharacterized protein n=1 Tax=Exidia glandulosa HHB12029 TaxID=1314781 RepID=A0A165B5C7_EXIGL|nr:hypothetical protein EXIGLDRAFT_447770 [Exidia glandulosa HHB12029]